MLFSFKVNKKKVVSANFKMFFHLYPSKDDVQVICTKNFFSTF